MPSFTIPLSGLLSNEEALSIISNNLANLNTVGYKETTPEFGDLFSQQLAMSGSGNPIQAGLGTQIASTSTAFTQGNIQSTGVPTDLAIQGDGFFQVQKNGVTMYTRDGNFSINAQGFMVAGDGSQVMGFPATNGVVTASGTLSPMVINSGQNQAARATSTVGLTMNLDASAAVGTTFSTAVQIFDSLGTTHVLTYNFTKSAANTWGYTITLPGADVGQTNPATLSSGNLTFDGAGNLTGPTANVTGITISGFADGAKNETLAWNLFNASGTPTVTQLAGTSNVSSTTQDGLSSGSLLHFTINPDGTIEGDYANGQTVKLGQIALATFPNNQGLLRSGSNNYLASLASGLPSVGVPGTGGRGTISDGALESSNVDIATEFAKLIVAQRGYESNARAFTTNNTVISDTLNLGIGQ